ncbi:TM2 domain-containing protein 1 biscotti isoform X2 [Arctopsyche grandis]|uniref:TM2 domain-containing protein 1 biscotti isoform X2 n=1 Tax=Arctopsyche grandis TaxID=121162 RepID=UPI00406D7C9B
MKSLYILLYITWLLPVLANISPTTKTYRVDCSTLRLGQYICPDPKIPHIDPTTQQLIGCTRDNKAEVVCLAATGLICEKTNTSNFKKEMPCKWTNGKTLETALLLSVFLGMFGLDRFYLGYPALGLAKLCTLGFMFVGQLLDILLIASQVVGPADGSAYIIPYFGAGVQVIRSDNNTYRLPQDDWNNVI